MTTAFDESKLVPKPNSRASTISISISKVDKSISWMMEELRSRDELFDLEEVYTKTETLWI